MHAERERAIKRGSFMHMGGLQASVGEHNLLCCCMINTSLPTTQFSY